MPKMHVVQLGKKNAPFELVERELPQPGPGEVRVKVQACGVCHSDSIAKEGLFPSVPYPIVPGHEIAGVIDAVGSRRDRLDRGHACRCWLVRRPLRTVRAMPPWLSIDCRNLRIPGITYDGGYAEAMVAPADALALIPDDLVADGCGAAAVRGRHHLTTPCAKAGRGLAISSPSSASAASAISASSSLRRWGSARSPIARGRDKEALARQLGAHVYLDSDCAGRGGGTDEARRRQDDPGDRHQRQGDERDDPGPGGPRQARCDRRRDGPDRGLPTRPDRRQPLGSRRTLLALRSIRRTPWPSAHSTGVRPTIETDAAGTRRRRPMTK